MSSKSDQTSERAETPARAKRRRKSAKTSTTAELYELPPVVTGYHPRPAKEAMKGIGMTYEPPYESAQMPIGQRAEHPEYDTGHPVARPVMPDEEDEAA